MEAEGQSQREQENIQVNHHLSSSPPQQQQQQQKKVLENVWSFKADNFSILI